MKKKLIALVMLAAISIFGAINVGCSTKSCGNSVSGGMQQCAACGLEAVGDFNYCANCICSFFVSDSCYERCTMGFCYASADCIRNCKDESSINGLDYINPKNYSISTHSSSEAIKEYNHYYKTTVSFYVYAQVDLYDFTIIYNISDVNGNYQNNIIIYVADEIKAYERKEVEQTLTFYKDDGQYVPEGRSNVEIYECYGRFK